MILYKKDNKGEIRYVDISSKGNLLIQKSGRVGTENPLEQETVCKGKNCVILQAPPMDEIKDKIFKHNNKCYKFIPVTTKCNANMKIVETVE